MDLFHKIVFACVMIMQPKCIYPQVSHMIVRGAICQRSLVSRTYCLQACLRECVDLGNTLTLYKMRCLSGKKNFHSEIGNELSCKCYFTQRRRIHKARGRKCLTSAYSWYNVQDFFLKNYMNRTDCVPSSKITNLNTPCGRIIVSMSNVTNIFNMFVSAIMQPTSSTPQAVTVAVTRPTTTATKPTTIATTTSTTEATTVTSTTTTTIATTVATTVASTAPITTPTLATTMATTEELIVTQQPDG